MPPTEAFLCTEGRDEFEIYLVQSIMGLCCRGDLEGVGGGGGGGREGTPAVRQGTGTLRFALGVLFALFFLISGYCHVR